MIWSIDDAHVAMATHAVRTHLLRTPLEPAPWIGEGISVKWENEQRTGSFKVRGALARLAALDEATRRLGVVAASAGNHGLGLAFAGRALGVRVTVCVPPATPQVKQRGIVELGAEIVVNDEPGYDSAERAARALAQQRGSVFVSPFDDPWVAAGNGATLAMEILDEVPDVRAIVVPVGGGGLLAGVAHACHGRGIALIGVQSEASPAMAEALRLGRAIESWPATHTLAEGLEGGISESTFVHARAAQVAMQLVSEAEIERTMRWTREALGRSVEGSGAVSLAWARRSGPPTGTVLVVTGGNVDPHS